MGGYVQRVDSNVSTRSASGSVWTFTRTVNQFLTGTAATTFTGTPASQAAGLCADRHALLSEPRLSRSRSRALLPGRLESDCSSLTLNLGIRYEFDSNPTALHNELYTVTNYPTNTALVNVPDRQCLESQHKNWDPRFGFAYDVFADHKTALRGGFAITHGPIFTARYNPDYTAVPPWPGLGTNRPLPTFNLATAFTPSARPAAITTSVKRRT